LGGGALHPTTDPLFAKYSGKYFLDEAQQMNLYVREYLYGQQASRFVMTSEKHEKFRELAVARTNRALDSIRKIGNLSNRQLYEWEEAEVRKIVRALKDAVGQLDQKFSGPQLSRDKGFRL
jgi:hypothetical protein